MYSLQVEKDQGLSGALHTAMQMKIPIYVLFPGPEASDLADMVRVHSQKQQPSQEIGSSAAEDHREEQPAGLHVSWQYLLIAIDGTWRQGKEMYRVSSVPLPFTMQTYCSDTSRYSQWFYVPVVSDADASPGRFRAHRRPSPS